MHIEKTHISHCGLLQHTENNKITKWRYVVCVVLHLVRGITRVSSGSGGGSGTLQEIEYFRSKFSEWEQEKAKRGDLTINHDDQQTWFCSCLRGKPWCDQFNKTAEWGMLLYKMKWAYMPNNIYNHTHMYKYMHTFISLLVRRRGRFILFK